MKRIARWGWVLALASASPAVSGAAAPGTKPWRAVWKITTESPFLRSPAVADGKAIVGTGHHVLAALELSTGKAVWTTKVRSAGEGVLAVGGVGYIGGRDNDMHAVDLRDGKLLWSYEAFTPWEVKGSKKGRPCHWVKALGVVGSCALFSSSDGNVYAIRLADGKKAWQLGLPPGSCRCLAEGVLYLAGGDKVWAVDAVTRGKLWATERSGILGFPYRFGSAVSMAGEGKVTALSAKDGSQLWLTDTERKGRMVPAPLKAVGDAVIALGEWDDSTVYALHKETGKILWQARVTGYPRSSTLWGNDKLLVATNAGVVSIIATRTGAVLAEHPLGVTGMEAPTVAGSTILVPSQEPVEGKPYGRGVLTAYRADARD